MRSSATARAVAGMLAVLLLATGVLAGATPSGAATASSDGNTPPFDFTDRFYKANGVNPSRILGRVTGSDGISVVDQAPDRNHRNVRVTLTIPTYDHSGNLYVWVPTGSLNGNGFTRDAAGQEARALAESSAIYLFPKTGGDPLSLDKRQEDVVDLRNGYFSNNPLGLWVNVFVNWTPKAFDTAEGRATLADLAERNGLAADGTPVIRTASEIDSLTAAGLVTQRRRPANGSAGPRYTICPVIEDPRDGAIAPDAFLVPVRLADGSVLPASQEFVRNFESLQATGDWAD
ncbi:MAG TPA: hypothetical protein VF640_00665 [Acidimicrobiales bacterium]